MSKKYACVISKQNMHLGRSFIYRRNNRGPRMEPCGTPRFIRAQLDSDESDYKLKFFDIYL
jgi:hypothetical protein